MPHYALVGLILRRLFFCSFSCRKMRFIRASFRQKRLKIKLINELFIKRREGLRTSQLFIFFWLSKKLKSKNSPKADYTCPAKGTANLRVVCLTQLKKRLTNSAIRKNIGKIRTYVRSVTAN